MKFTKTLSILLAIILLSCSGCSTVTFGYNHADWLLRYWAYGYTSFTPGQKEEIRHDIDDYMRWHRKEALPEYIAFLQDLNTTIAQETLHTDDVIRVRSGMGRLYSYTLAPAVRPAAHILSTLDKGQIEELRKTLIKQNLEEREESIFGNQHSNLDTRAKKYVHSVEDLAGHLSHEQEEKIKTMSMGIPFVTDSYIEQRESRQAAMIALLKDHATEETINAFLAQWINKPVSPMSAQAQQAFDAYDKAMNEMLVQIFGLLTPRQKEHLHKKITGYIDDFRQLHAAAAQH